MRLLFIENRYATRLYEAVAPALLNAGHELHWLVQNPRFAPQGLGSVHLLPLPSQRELRAAGDDPLYARLRQADRAVRHFGVGDRHYEHYVQRIGAELERLSPDVVFGESTQAHELITIELCRRLGLRYLFPTATRYPPGRICFLREDSMEPVGGCGETLPEADARAMIDGVNRRAVTPSYMTPARTSRMAAALRRAGDRAHILAGWVGGERYVTPAPWVKLRLDREHERQRLRWDGLARTRPLAGRRYFIYPLQMQPESTIDVWGLPWNDQPEIVRRAAAALAPLGLALMVKPNPKPKYEVDSRLCDVADAMPNVVPVAHGVPMGPLLTGADAVLSVTGTVLIEAVFAGKPAFALGSHAMARYPGVTAIDVPEALASIAAARDASAVSEPASSAAAGRAIELLQHLHCTSYPALVPDPLNQAERLVGDLRAPLSNAFLALLSQIGGAKRQANDVSGCAVAVT